MSELMGMMDSMSVWPSGSLICWSLRRWSLCRFGSFSPKQGFRRGRQEIAVIDEARPRLGLDPR